MNKNITKEFYKKIDLPYKLNELEPIINFLSMHYHYDVLHENYKINLNEKILEEIEEEKLRKDFPTLEKLMKCWEQLPSKLKEDVRFFGGGLINHNFFFANLTKPYKEEEKIDPDLLALIQKKYTSLKELKAKLIESSLKVRGSGWTWLVLNEDNQLQIVNTANQDSPWLFNLRPLIAIDVWEHSYYLDFGTDRKEYVKKLLGHLLNWKYISNVYLDYKNS
ncbi:superoxide dismutase [endosymbiont GvMRE of Glomus versiforme]|uniref:superoxide dismutase n=1 Tax=endosymbiont GvMRE of Glomus versiforme TaxID=2039283 RepID=UPI000ED44A47|nr:superoxide dismutase [endosymbiont GvMRE of Glomus versiforme]RHZ35495.1 Superoxide dismutase [endosymbiont GvMRE of Glomus versiforme]